MVRARLLIPGGGPMLAREPAAQGGRHVERQEPEEAEGAAREPAFGPILHAPDAGALNHAPFA
ncbi:MAG: hypothetical protein ACREEL_10020 [Stellaceae bacterium]